MGHTLIRVDVEARDTQTCEKGGGGSEAIAGGWKTWEAEPQAYANKGWWASRCRPKKKEAKVRAILWQMDWSLGRCTLGQSLVRVLCILTEWAPPWTAGSDNNDRRTERGEKGGGGGGGGQRARVWVGPSSRARVHRETGSSSDYCCGHIIGANNNGKNVRRYRYRYTVGWLALHTHTHTQPFSLALLFGSSLTSGARERARTHTNTLVH